MTTSYPLTDAPVSPHVADDEQTLGQFIPLLYHYNMLQDADRVGAFREAIDLVVQPGMHVVELGGGTGILSSFAAKRGARVTCVERNPELVACARRFVGLNELEEQITVVRADACEFVSDTPVDVVVCEMLHVGLLREKQAQVIAAFKKNHVRKHGPKLPIFLPEASILMAEPVTQSFDFAGYHAPVPLFHPPRVDQPGTQAITTLSPYANIAYDGTIPMKFNVRQDVTPTNNGQANAVRFVTQNVITVDIDSQRAITWPNQCLVLPLRQPVKLTMGMKAEMSFHYQAGGSVESLASTLKLVSIAR
ncbi:ribosomal protein L11 methyltransferase [Rubripirellula tenax]|uniref:Ribosomal protein L11 methyltransferase n=1 Tax=Rubripirellula tenax TaxID=2528015 RepID=A0A5C6F6A7_9BACT|nr:methyltransferase domain-containing protein [Rubripirellula tenax]TWU56522.1 ribosomal protein L11 methyltransferase [Rubripirellula tenax]